MTYLRSNIYTKNYWNRTTIVEIIVGDWVVLFLRHSVDAAYCYQPSSVVYRSVGLSVTLVNPAKTAAPIKMPCG